MPLDPRSRERLEALGRSLPQPLPAPEPIRSRKAEASVPRHPVETEEDPEQLFRELMAASPDGSVPPHLLERLRQLEQARVTRRPAVSPTPGPSPARRSPAVRPEQELYEAFEDLLSLAEDHESPSGREPSGGPDRLAPRPAERPRRFSQR